MFQAELKEIKQDSYVEIIIKGDINDGDYVRTIKRYRKSVLEDEEFLKAFYYFINYREHPMKNYIVDMYQDLNLTYEEAEEIDEYIEGWVDIPSYDGYYCHTIESVSMVLYEENGKQYNISITNK